MCPQTSLEHYFDFLAPDDIRLKGHRIGIDVVLGYYLDGYTPEEISMHLPSLSMEEIYATITYYLHCQPQIDAYLIRLAAYQEQRYQDAWNHPSPLMDRLRKLNADRQQQRANVS